MTGKPVHLEFYEMFHAATAGVMRNIENKKLKRKPAYGAQIESDWQISIEGALGEFALCKYLGVFWLGKGGFRGADLYDKAGEPMEVRTSQFGGESVHLPLYERDHDDRKYWLLTGHNGDYAVHGWIYGRDGKRAEFWRQMKAGRAHAFWVPKSELTLP